jgi:HKD family nuclease
MTTRALIYENELLEQLTESFDHARDFALAFALITVEGLNHVIEHLRSCLQRGATGRILIGVDLPTEPAAIEGLDRMQRECNSLKVRVFWPSRKRVFHPKLSIFCSEQGKWSAIVGSANLTNRAMVANYEVSLFVDDQGPVRSCREFFEECFHGGHARIIDGPWLDQYRQNFRLRLQAERALERARLRVLRQRATRRHARSLPKRIRGHRFAFTGKIDDWPRDDRLYPFVRRHGGEIAYKAGSLESADCLVHGQILGGRKTTRKLAAAEKHQVPIISDEEFFEIAKREKRKK